MTRLPLLLINCCARAGITNIGRGFRGYIQQPAFLRFSSEKAILTRLQSLKNDKQIWQEYGKVIKMEMANVLNCVNYVRS